MIKLLKFPHKTIRAQVIHEYIGNNRVVCFSCGNASRALKEQGMDVLDISPSGDLLALRWFTQRDILHNFENYFDATSGHLNNELMGLIGKAFKDYLGDIKDNETIYVPTGSGETLVCLKMAYPKVNFIAVYNINEATEFSEYAPLNMLVKLLATDIIYNGKEFIDNNTYEYFGS